MNLYYMVQRSDSNLVVSEGVHLGKRKIDGDTWRGLVIAPGGQIRLRDILRFYPFHERPSHCDWYAAADNPKASSQPWLKVSLWDVEAGRAISERSLSPADGLRPLLLPWPMTTTPLPAKLDLVIENSAGASQVFLAVHRALSREVLFENAIGTGVEVGPGANPQLKSNGNRDVFYVEQKPPEDWEQAYGPHGNYTYDRTLWQKYKIGEAHQLPFADGSLDFIFSSHVFEHLANPLGHLKHWRAKLRSGGVVLGIVPDLAGAKDGELRPSTLQEVVEEYKADIWAPTEAHYRRYFKNIDATFDPSDWLRERPYVHVHFYTLRNMSELLDHACIELDYRGFHIQHSPNHKDFHFLLIAA